MLQHIEMTQKGGEILIVVGDFEDIYMLEHLEMLKNGRVRSLEALSHSVHEFVCFLSNPCVWVLPRYLRC